MRVEAFPFAAELEHATAFADPETGQRFYWVHIPLEAVQTVYKQIRFSRYCETPRHVGRRVAATVFHAFFYGEPHSHIDTFVSCLECHALIGGTDPASGERTH